jgi:hypothetical protein
MSTEKRNATLSVMFYAISITAVIFFNLSGQYKSGPCTPNLDVFSIYFVSILNTILLIINAILTFGLKRQTRYSYFIHLSVFIIWITFLIFNSL